MCACVCMFRGVGDECSVCVCMSRLSLHVPCAFVCVCELVHPGSLHARMLAVLTLHHSHACDCSQYGRRQSAGAGARGGAMEDQGQYSEALLPWALLGDEEEEEESASLGGGGDVEGGEGLLRGRAAPTAGAGGSILETGLCLSCKYFLN